MGTIVTIGGGEIRNKSETDFMDQYIVNLANTTKPNVLFVPTASSDSIGYIAAITNQYQKKLGCILDTLLLCDTDVSVNDMQQKADNADIIYVGGGNTLKMMQIWQKSKFDAVLQGAYENGTILCGLSAGAICWFESGHSDSLSFSQEKWEYIRVSGLGLIDAIHCPHYDSATGEKPRRQYFHDFMKKPEQAECTGIAIDEKVAIEWTDGMYKVVTNNKTAGAYKISASGNVVTEDVLPNDGNYHSIAELLGNR